MKPDYAQAKTFLDLMHPWEKSTFQTVPRDGADIKAKVLYGHLDELWTELVDWNLRGANIYCMVNQGNGRGRSLCSVTAITSFFVSVRNAPVERVTSLQVKPHVIVATGVESYQAHWKVQPTPVTDSNRARCAEEFRRIQIALAQKVGGDPTLTDLARVADVPGFLSYKRGPFQVGLHDTENHAFREIDGLPDV
jgi:hypothetical protein